MLQTQVSYSSEGCSVLPRCKDSPNESVLTETNRKQRESILRLLRQHPLRPGTTNNPKSRSGKASTTKMASFIASTTVSSDTRAASLHRKCPPKLEPVTLGRVTLETPIILAPMASVTNPPFRSLCRFYGASLTISEMLHASYFLSDRISPSFRSDETRSVQLYGTEPLTLSSAAARLVQEYGVSHIDLNFGCPAPKILRKGGGAAVPGDTRRFREIVEGVVKASSGVAVTVKLRAGCFGNETYMEAARIAENAGCAGVILHARTAEEGYDRGVGRSGWWRIRRLVEEVGIPVFGNGDVFTGEDAVDMVRETGCAGVVIGRGCLGRPWLFDEIRGAFLGGDGVCIPEVGVVTGVMLRLVEEIVEYLCGRGMDEFRAIRAVRKWYGWFLQGYIGTEDLVEKLKCAESLTHVRDVVNRFDEVVRIDQEIVIRERGKLGRE